MDPDSGVIIRDWEYFIDVKRGDDECGIPVGFPEAQVEAVSCHCAQGC